VHQLASDWEDNFFFLAVDPGNRLFTPLKKKGLQAASKDKTASLTLALPQPSQPEKGCVQAYRSCPTICKFPIVDT